MKTLRTSRLKPNPDGKDKDRYGRPTTEQLAAEWADIKNVGTAPIEMAGVRLYHVVFVNGQPSRWDSVINFTSGVLQPGAVVRVHAGHGPARATDLAGADHHVYTGENRYVWNNEEGDTARITEAENGAETETDMAGYDPYPPEGVVLIRSGNKLVPTGAGLAV